MTTYVHAQDFSSALDSYQQALSISRDIGNRSLESAILYSMGQLYIHTGSYEEGINLLFSSLSSLDSENAQLETEITQSLIQLGENFLLARFSPQFYLFTDSSNFNENIDSVLSFSMHGFRGPSFICRLQKPY